MTTPKHPTGPRNLLLTSLRWLAGAATLGTLLWSVFWAPFAWWLPALLGAGWIFLMLPFPKLVAGAPSPSPSPSIPEKAELEVPRTLPTEEGSIKVAGTVPVKEKGIEELDPDPCGGVQYGGEVPPPPDDPPKNGGYLSVGASPDETTEPTRSARPARETEPVRFLALHPARIVAEGSPFWAYAFTPSESAEVFEDADLQAGDHGPWTFSSGTAREGIESGAVLVAKPEGEGLRFDPPQVPAKWRGRWRRFDFRVMVEAGRPARLQGKVSFTVEGLLIAEVPFELTVGESPVAETTRSPAADLYQAVFASYSHRDQQIVERVERAYRALGMTYLRDVTTLRSGQKWKPELGRLIEQAELFQLFWSSEAAASEYVTEEWQTALRLIREKKKPETFIRPVYWEEPMPAPPAPLGDTHFAYEPDLEK